MTSRRDHAPRRRVSRAALAAVVLVPALAVSASADEHLRVTTPTRVTAEDAAPSRTYQDPAMVAHPQDPTTILVGSQEQRGRTCHVFRSTDTGHSWEMPDASPMVDPDVADCFHTGAMYTKTPMATGGGGRMYYGLSSWPEDAAGPQDHAAGETNVQVAYSDDAGDSWTATMVRDATEWEDGQEDNRLTSLAAEARGGDDDVVYATWESRYSSDDAPPGQPSIAVSEDGGQTYADPVSPIPADVDEELGGEDGLSAGRAKLAVSDDGVVYAVFSVSPAEGYGEGRLAVSKSDDRGQTWTYHEITDPEEWPDFSYQEVTWSPEGGPDGTLHVVYESDPGEEPTGQRDIFHQRSTDGGETWTDPQQLNDDGPDSLAGQYNATVEVAPNGRVDVAWFDFRDGQERFANDIYYTYSEDNGDTWGANVRVTDQSVNRHLGTWSNDFDMRGTPGMVSADEYALVAWSDTRNADQAGQSQDIYSAAVQHEDLGGSAGALPIVLAAVGGLFAAGLLLFGVGFGLRLRGGARPTAPAGS